MVFKNHSLTWNCSSSSRDKYNKVMLVLSLPILLLFGVAYSSIFSRHEKKVRHSYFALCLIIKDNAEDLPEWVEYHHRMGTSKFYIFDHNSTVPVINYIREYVLSGLVDLTFSTLYRPDNRPPQLVAYERCLHDHKKNHQFIGFIDSDEFIVVKEKNVSIPSVLKRYEKYGSLALNWMMFGSSGHIERPGGVLGNYNRCHKYDHVKQIVNMDHVLRTGDNPHYFVYQPPYYAVSTNRTHIPSHYNEGLDTAYDVMYINHYNTKSQSELLAKIRRGRGAMRDVGVYTLDYLKALDQRCVDVCPFLEMPPQLSLNP